VESGIWNHRCLNISPCFEGKESMSISRSAPRAATRGAAIHKPTYVLSGASTPQMVGRGVELCQVMPTRFWGKGGVQRDELAMVLGRFVK
jgi:hypothetical protein